MVCPGLANGGSSAWIMTAATLRICMRVPSGTVMPNCLSMLLKDWVVKGDWFVWSPVPSSPTTRPYPTNALERTPATEAMSFMRSAWANVEAANNAKANSKRCVNIRSEEHTSELQSRGHLVCRLLLEKEKT